VGCQRNNAEAAAAALEYVARDRAILASITLPCSCSAPYHVRQITQRRIPAMAHTFTSLLIHVIFSTKHRAALLTPAVRERLFPYMGGIIRERNATALLINGIEDHVHILTSLPTTMPLSDFVRDIKSVSSGWVNDGMMPRRTFGWQIGYAAFSVSKSNAETVRDYIERQQQHHARMTFQEEYLKFLERHEISYDPRFVFEEELSG
jgi:putative transposase